MADALTEIVETIGTTMFTSPIVRTREPLSGGTSTITAFIHLEGEWRGAVMLQSPLDLATELTAELLGSREPPGADEVRDAMGEFTNMVAGNLKPLLPQPSSISLPAVVVGADYQLEMARTTPVDTVAFSCRDRRFAVTLLERADDRPENG